MRRLRGFLPEAVRFDAARFPVDDLDFANGNNLDTSNREFRVIGDAVALARPSSHRYFAACGGKGIITILT